MTNAFEPLERVEQWNDAAEELRLFALAIERRATDSGERISLAEVAASFGIDLDELDATED